MVLADIISQVSVLLSEAAAYHNAGNFDDAHKMLVSMKAYLDEELPVQKVYPLPKHKSQPPTTANGDRPPTKPS